MPLSDEKLEQILSVMVDSFQAFQATQAATAQMNSELFKMLEKQISVQEASMNMNADIRMLKSEMNMNGTGDATGQGLTTPKKFSNKARPKRPVVEGDIDDVEWGIFIDKWKIYKSIAELEEHEICMELRETCSPAVYKLLYQFVGPDELNKQGIKEVDMLMHIKGVAVKSVHKEVHRWNYNQMSQETGESISKYVGRLKSQAGLCDFNVKCRCGDPVSYSEEMIGQRMVAGLTNADHQSRIISEADVNTDLKAKVTRLIALETTDEATQQLRTAEPSRFAAAKSQHKLSQGPSGQRSTPGQRSEDNSQKTSFRGRSEKNQRGRSSYQERTPQQRRRCRGCGRTSHGNGKSLTREECPANGKACDACGVENHFAKVCSRRRTRASYVRMEDDTSGSECETSDCSEFEDEDTETGNEATNANHYSARMAQDFRQRPQPPYRDRR